MTEKIFDLAIIGAGPAGMAAAIEARKHGLSVVLFDEGASVGGQVYRSVLETDTGLTNILGPDYIAGRSLAEEFLSSEAKYHQRAAVFLIERSETKRHLIGATIAGKTLMVESQFVLIATGALERPFPIPGWTIPGVMTAGAAQTMLKANGAVPTGKICLAGCGPLLYLLAAQYIRAGVKIAAVLDTTPRSNWVKSLPYLPEFLFSPYFRKGLKLLREVTSNVPLEKGVSSLQALGKGKLTELRYTVGKREKSIKLDTLLLHQGVVPQVNLTMSVGAKHHWNEEQLTFEPELDSSGQTSVPGVFVAGDSASIGGAEAASSNGTLIACAIVKAIDSSKAGACQSREAQANKGFAKAVRGRAFLNRLYRPAQQFRMPTDDVVVCRCEEVRAGEIREISSRGAMGPNQLKAFCRAGMGPCQGRMCGLTVSELMAQEKKQSPADIGYMNIRSPVKPVSLGEISNSYEGNEMPDGYVNQVKKNPEILATKREIGQ